MQQDKKLVQTWLEEFLTRHGAIAGTVHYERDGDLFLAAAYNIPPEVLEKVTHVTHGKGMAGLAQVRREPVQTCNLQTDTSGQINPMAKLVSGQAAVALPVLTDDGGVRAVVGLAFAEEGELPRERTGALMAEAVAVP